MAAYWILMAFPIYFSILPINNKKVTHVCLLFVSLIYIFFIGFRDEVGMDWSNYIRIYNDISSVSLEKAITLTEPAYALLNWLSAQANLDIYGSNFIIAILFTFGLVKFAEKMPLPWIALICITPYLVIAIGMSGVRQAAAIGIVFYLLAGWGKNTTVKNIILASLATSFHYSAFVALLFVVQNLKIPTWFRWIILLIGGVITFIIFTQTDRFTTYEKVYITENLESTGALQHASLNAIPAFIYLFFIKRWNTIYGKNSLMITLSILSLLSIAGVFFSSTGVDRLSLYLSPIQMLVYSTIPVVFKNQLYSVLILIMHLGILYVWLNYANNASAFIPYNNIFF